MHSAPPPLVQSYINERVKGGLSPNSIRKHYCIIHKCLDYAVRLDLFLDDPLESAVHLAVSYGMRRSEICGLRWEAVAFDAGTLYVCHTAVKNEGEIIFSDNTKTATSRRHLPLTAAIQTYLKPNGVPLDPDFVAHLVPQEQ